MLGVIIGIILLLLLIGLVVLQAAIEWGGFDASKIIKDKDEKPQKQQVKITKKTTKNIKRKGKK
ncbi:MAG: hypothetical protein N3E50_08090 [Candidatus Goldbacteria bacterium]|nr:hypothetical protein [Candidatus Goldiibacteriota bacterium]